jgi:hypothetical protein
VVNPVLPLVMAGGWLWLELELVPPEAELPLLDVPPLAVFPPRFPPAEPPLELVPPVEVVFPPRLVLPPLDAEVPPDPAEAPVVELLLVVFPPFEIVPPFGVELLLSVVPPLDDELLLALLWLVVPPDVLLELPSEDFVPPFPALFVLLDCVVEPEFPPWPAGLGGVNAHAEMAPTASNARIGVETNFMSTPLLCYLNPEWRQIGNPAGDVFGAQTASKWCGSGKLQRHAIAGRTAASNYDHRSRLATIVDAGDPH